MAECAGRRQKKNKKKSKNSDQESSPEDENGQLGDKEILKFLIAAQSDDVETLQQFLERGMPVDTECLMFSDTALIKACRTGSTEAARLLLDRGANISAKTDNDETALHVAVKNRQTSIIKLLFSYGVPLDERAFHYQLTPLMIAASMGKTTIVKMLIEEGCALDLQDRNGLCALHHCFKYFQGRAEFAAGCVKCLKILVDAGASLHLRESQGKFPLTMAIERKNVQGVKYLLDQNCEPDNQLLGSPPMRHLSPLVFAVSVNDPRLAELLWQAGASCEGVYSPLDIPVEPWRKNTDPLTFPFSRPRSLKEACRKAVRSKLRSCGGVGRKFRDHVNELSIPKSLKYFILLEDVLESIPSPDF